MKTTTPLPSDAWRSSNHKAEHFFQGVCICTCKNCTKSSKVSDRPHCICPSCPEHKCGLKLKGM